MRWTIIGVLAFVAATLMTGHSGPATAQDGAEATIAALQTRVAELEATVEARGDKINAQRTQIAELKKASDDRGPRCIDVDQSTIDTLMAGIEDPSGMSLVAVQAVKSSDFEKIYFVAGNLLGPGMGDGEIVVLATNDVTAPTIAMSINTMAQEFFVWPDGDSTDARITMDDDGAKHAESCTKALLKD